MQRSFRTKLVQLLRRIAARFSNRYRPELHYMRGPGPKSLAASIGSSGKARN